ncbi:MAG: cytochrome c [Roseiarcus sp.]|uniref:SorB family sulfite dehydrogenase c-type cytochrome subunit n=1 Tax=Roseiarcus sp. TaxID=1969460 RepID=UPI003BAF00B3
MNRIVFISLVAFAALVTTAIAGSLTYELPDETADLKPGPGVEAAGVCLACHSADYISTQPSNEGKAFWEAEVQKMIKVYKAPIDPSDAPAIADYLAANY